MVDIDKLIEEILSLTEMALEHRPEHIGGDACVVIAPNLCRAHAWTVSVKYPIVSGHHRKRSTAIYALTTGDTVAEALVALADKCGLGAARAYNEARVASTADLCEEKH